MFALRGGNKINNIQTKQDYHIFDTLPGALIEVSLATQSVIYMNIIARVIFEYSQANIDEGIPINTIFSDNAEYQRALEITKAFGLESYETGTPYTRLQQQDLYDFMLKKKGGELFQGECQSSFVLDENSIPTGIRVYIRDLTEQRLMEASLHESEKKYRLLIENSIDCIWTLDTSMRFTFISPTLENILGFKPEQWIGTRLSSHFRKREFLKIGSIAAAALKNYKTFKPIAMETIMLNNENEEVRLEITGNVLLDDEGKLLGLQGTTRDITNRKLMEEALVESESKYHNIFTNSHDAIYISTEEGSLTEFNQTLVKMLGYSAEELYKMDLSELYDDESERLQFQERMNTHGYIKEFELKIPKKDGTVIDCLDTATLYKRSNGKIEYHGILRDITEEKIAKRRIEEALVEAESANMVKDQFISNVTHEVRTPLTSIIGFTDYLRKNLAHKLEETDKESFEFISQNSNRLLRMVNAILNLSKLQSGKLHQNPSIVYLESLCENICDELRPSADRKGLRLNFTSTTEDDRVWLDESTTRQSLENIIRNGIKYTDKGRIDVSLEQAGKHQVIRVSDTGIGMTEDYIDQAFQPFNQESEGMTRDYQGIGLGLALSKRYLEWNKIKIALKSKRGIGTTFTLTFPVWEKNDLA